jgi:hypothetical protein
MGSAQTRKLLKKLDQNFQTLVQCEHTAFMNKKADFRLRKSTTTIHYSLFTIHSSLKNGGVGKGKLLSRSFLSPRKNKKPQKPQKTKSGEKYAS